MSPGRRPIPEGRDAMEADVREVIRGIEAEGGAVTAGAVREAYGGPAGGSWQPYGDPEHPEVPADSLDPLMESVLRDLEVTGALPEPEPAVEPGATSPATGQVEDRVELPLVDGPSGPVLAIEDRPTVVLHDLVPSVPDSGESSAFRLRRRSPTTPRAWDVSVTSRDPAQSFTLHLGMEFTGDGGALDLHAVQRALAARGVHVEPAQRWYRSSLDRASTRALLGRSGIRKQPDDPGPWATEPAYAPRRPTVRVRPIVVGQPILHPTSYSVDGWEYSIETGNAETSRRGTVADRHVTPNGDLDVGAFAEELRADGIAIDEPEQLLLSARPGGRGADELGDWETLPGTRFLGEPPPLTPSPEDTARDRAASASAGALKWVVGGIGGMLVLAVAVPRLVGDDTTEPSLPVAQEPFDDAGTPDVAPAVEQVTPLPPAVEPPSTYQEPTLDFAADPPADRAAASGSVWGTSTWTTVDVSATVGSPPPTVFPEGQELQVEFVIFADCADELDAATCAFSIDRGATRVPLVIDGLRLTGEGDAITDGCSGRSGIEYTVSDLTVVDGRLVPTYLTGRRYFEEICPTWERFLDLTHNGRYVDRPSLTP